jgi:hypothetical protein
MKSMVYSVVAIFTLVCSALAQDAPASVDSVAYDSNPSSLQLRAQTGANNTVTLTWRGDPNASGFILYESIGHGPYAVVAQIGPNAVSYSMSGLSSGVPYIFKLCDFLEPQTCSNEVLVRFPR